MCSLSLLLAAGFWCLSTVAATATRPDKIYGVNLGSWLLIENWMLPAEWERMGGERCDDCSTCISSEFEFAKAYPDTVDEMFEEHWNTWFNQNDVDELVSLGINTVRIPLGYWIVESLVNRDLEFFPRGGINQLARGLKQLKEAGIVAILDHHALPGAAAINQLFAGQCTNSPQFYHRFNYNRALIWAAVMTGLSHLHPDFSTVFSIHAINEPIMNASRTPGHGDYQRKFVKTVRAMESLLGIGTFDGTYKAKRGEDLLYISVDVGLAFSSSTKENCPFGDVCDVIIEALPILGEVLDQLGSLELSSVFGLVGQPPLETNFMDVTWQYNNPPNAADIAMGPQSYDNHLYYNFGGVADPNPKAYLTHLCNLDRVENAVKNRNVPLWFGEWSLATNFNETNTTDAFLRDWADAQKLQYGKDAGWIFWNFKIENSTLAGETARQWSYTEGVRRGYFTRDPAAYHNASVCEQYIIRNSTTNSTSSSA
ncbi:hypothetical protein D9758_007129 [Tetrapyrgos nigripes]|uniref:Glycoside hydrolase family 5 domain-containing protein n=1 Tax=Tetrapyrgos nigripes TaxID=182062 RepID=A0A8H5LMU2_9AGAR|nr:hypothetical protein D9758_007129 [Tetrapyrgos nigripes]